MKTEFLIPRKSGGSSRKILHVISKENDKSCQKDSQRFQKQNDLEGARACKKYNECMDGKARTSSAPVLKHKEFDTLSLSPDANVRASEVPPPRFFWVLKIPSSYNCMPIWHINIIYGLWLWESPLPLSPLCFSVRTNQVRTFRLIFWNL